MKIWISAALKEYGHSRDKNLTSSVITHYVKESAAWYYQKLHGLPTTTLNQPDRFPSTTHPVS